MTAASTPRLGLMSPTNTDPFVPDDFVASFTTLDNKPGFTLVPNYAGLPSGLTSAQHGSPYLQLDNGAAWYWYRPSNVAPGVWKRLNSLGVLGRGTQAASVTTTTTDLAASPTICSINATNLPGGRWMQLTLETGPSGTNGGAQVNLFSGGSLLKAHIVITNKANHIGKDVVTFLPPVAPGSGLVLRASICAALIPTSVGGYGSINVSNSVLTLSEV